jgi:2-methylisocitrate lyase-like PEP mutase family enzyme
MRATSQLRQLLKSGQPLFVPGYYNALSARIVADVGFPATYIRTPIPLGSRFSTETGVSRFILSTLSARSQPSS